jgi:hypothetical protein
LGKFWSVSRSWGAFVELGLKRAQETQIQTVVTRNLGAVEVAGANPVVRVDVRLSSGDIQSFRLDGGSLRPWVPAPEARKTEFVAFVRAAGNEPIARFPYASEIVFEKGLYFYNRVAEAARPLPLQAFRRQQVLTREVMVHNHPAVWVSNGHDFMIVHQRTGATLYHSKDSESWRRLATGQIEGVAGSLNGREIALAVGRKVIVYDLWSEVIPEPQVIFYRERVRFGAEEGQNQRRFHWVNGQFTLF